MIEINGVQYEEIKKETAKAGDAKRVSNLMTGVMMLYAPYMMGMTGGNTYSRQRPNVNLIEEFKLIQEKKSKLSKSNRDWVVVQFNKTYKEIKQ